MFKWSARRANWLILLAALLSVVFLCALVSFIYVGQFTRYMADDYCLAVAMRTAGFLRFQSSMYVNWTGKFSLLFLTGLSKLIGPSILPFLPFLAITLWLAAATWAVYQIARLAGWPRPLFTSWLVAEVFVFAAVNSSHNIVQTFYWESGMLGYAPPLALSTVLVGMVSFAMRRPSLNHGRWLLLIIMLVLTFFAGGFSESYVFLQTAAFLLAVVACYLPGSALLKQQGLPLLLAGFGGSLAALTVVLIAPGNSVRQTFFPPPPNVFKLIGLSLYYSVGFVGYTIYLSPLTTALLLSFFGLLGRYFCLKWDSCLKLNSRTLARLLWSLPLAGFFLIFVCFVPAVYGTSNYLPGRARIFPQLVFVCTTICWSYFAGMLLARRFTSARASKALFASAAVACALTILTPLSATWRTLGLVPRARAAAAIWDQTDREIPVAKANGIRDLTVVAINDVESTLGAKKTELQLEADPLNWKNKCAAQYYEVDSISAK